MAKFNDLTPEQKDMVKRRMLDALLPRIPTKNPGLNWSTQALKDKHFAIIDTAASLRLSDYYIVMKVMDDAELKSDLNKQAADEGKNYRYVTPTDPLQPTIDITSESNPTF